MTNSQSSRTLVAQLKEIKQQADEYADNDDFDNFLRNWLFPFIAKNPQLCDYYQQKAFSARSVYTDPDFLKAFDRALVLMQECVNRLAPELVEMNLPKLNGFFRKNKNFSTFRFCAVGFDFVPEQFWRKHAASVGREGLELNEDTIAVFRIALHNIADREWHLDFHKQHQNSLDCQAYSFSPIHDGNYIAWRNPKRRADTEISRGTEWLDDFKWCINFLDSLGDRLLPKSEQGWLQQRINQLNDIKDHEFTPVFKKYLTPINESFTNLRAYYVKMAWEPNSSNHEADIYFEVSKELANESDYFSFYFSKDFQYVANPQKYASKIFLDVISDMIAHFSAQLYEEQHELSGFSGGVIDQRKQKCFLAGDFIIRVDVDEKKWLKSVLAIRRKEGKIGKGVSISKTLSPYLLLLLRQPGLTVTEKTFKDEIKHKRGKKPVSHFISKLRGVFEDTGKYDVIPKIGLERKTFQINVKKVDKTVNS